MVESGINKRSDSRIELQMALLSSSSKTVYDVKYNLKPIKLSSVTNLFILILSCYLIISFIFINEAFYFYFFIKKYRLILNISVN